MASAVWLLGQYSAVSVILNKEDEKTGAEIFREASKDVNLKTEDTFAAIDNKKLDNPDDLESTEVVDTARKKEESPDKSSNKEQPKTAAKPDHGPPKKILWY